MSLVQRPCNSLLEGWKKLLKNYYILEGTGLLISSLTRLVANEPSTKTVTATTRIVTVTAPLKSKAKNYLIAHVENVDQLLSNKFNIS